MKLSFSTVGCPNWKWSEIIAAASDLGYDGIELRGLGEDIYMPDIRIFMPENLASTAAQLKRARVEVACVATDCLLHGNDRDYTTMAREYILLANALGAKYIRLLGDTWGWPGENVDTGLVKSRLAELAPFALENNVVMLLETNGVFAESARLKTLVKEVGSPALRVLWDINHPLRYFGESIDQTWANIGEYVLHVHVKDSVMEDGRPRLRMLGYGDLPVGEAFAKLKGAGYAGYLSLEWTKRWNDELEDAGVVFSQYIYACKGLWETA